MPRKGVIILSGHSLFAEGTASSLREHGEGLELDVLDPGKPDLLEQIASAQPTVVILDSTDPELIQRGILEKLLKVVPTPKLMLLDSQAEDVQILTCEHRRAGEVRDLIDLILANG